MKKLFFFVREYNDFDHLLPIIYYLNKKKIFSIKIFSIGTNIYKSKHHLKILNNELNLKIKKFDELYKKNIFYYLHIFFFKLIDKIKVRNKYLNILIFFCLKSLSLLSQYFFFKIFKSKFLKIFLNSVIIPDFGTENIFPYNGILKICKKNKIPIVAYAHGVNIFSNLDPIRTSLDQPNIFKKFILNILLLKFNNYYYDKYLVGIEQNVYFRSTMYKSFNKTELKRIVEIGIPRFTDEWIQILDNYYNKNFKSTKKINLCIFLSNEKFNVDIYKLDNLLKRLSTLNNINFMIKGHTRSGLSGLKNKSYSNYISNEESNNIISNIDIAIAYGTSIVFQALQKRIPLLIPSYLDNNNHIFIKYEACYEAKNEESVIEFIDKYNKELYWEEKKINIKKFINKIVYNNQNYETMMEQYVNFFKKI